MLTGTSRAGVVTQRNARDRPTGIDPFHYALCRILPDRICDERLSLVPFLAVRSTVQADVATDLADLPDPTHGVAHADRVGSRAREHTLPGNFVWRVGTCSGAAQCSGGGSIASRPNST